MIEIIRKNEQAQGQFNNGEIIEYKPIGFPQDEGKLNAYSNLFYWAYAEAESDSTIGLHPHRGFEIMTVVLEGKIQHYDTLLKQWIPLESGSVQLIQSGSGISHSETLHAGAKIFQIWFDPNLSYSLGQKPNYQDFRKEAFKTTNGKRVITNGNTPIKLQTQGIEIVEQIIEKGSFSLELKKDSYYSIYLTSGELETQNSIVKTNDFMRVSEEELLEVEAFENSRILYIKTPLVVPYRTFA